MLFTDAKLVFRLSTTDSLPKFANNILPPITPCFCIVCAALCLLYLGEQSNITIADITNVAILIHSASLESHKVIFFIFFIISPRKPFQSKHFRKCVSSFPKCEASQPNKSFHFYSFVTFARNRLQVRSHLTSQCRTRRVLFSQ